MFLSRGDRDLGVAFFYGGVNGDLLQEGLCRTQVCSTQSPCSRPLLTPTSTGDIQTQFWLSLCRLGVNFVPFPPPQKQNFRASMLVSVTGSLWEPAAQARVCCFPRAAGDASVFSLWACSQLGVVWGVSGFPGRVLLCGMGESLSHLFPPLLESWEVRLQPFWVG